MAASRRKLALPEGSRRIFDQGLPLLLEFIPAEHLLLGGGTALAARWQHRDSLDIDLFTSRTTFTEAIFRQRAQFEARLEELGSGRIAMLGPDGCAFYVHGAKVEVLSFPPLTHPSRSVDCTGSPSIALETSLEILAKKLHRRMIVHGRIVPRDLYDLAYARRFEPAPQTVRALLEKFVIPKFWRLPSAASVQAGWSVMKSRWPTRATPACGTAPYKTCSTTSCLAFP